MSNLRPATCWGRSSYKQTSISHPKGSNSVWNFYPLLSAASTTPLSSPIKLPTWGVYHNRRASLRIQSDGDILLTLEVNSAGCGRTGQEPQLQLLLKLFVDCKIVYPTVTNRISMFTQKLQHLSLLFMNQMFVLNKD